MAEKKRRVAVIGGGAAGVSAAWSLARSLKEDVEVTIVEPCGSLGGVACTKRLKNGQFVNYGVQGGAPASHRNINSLLKEFGEDIDDAHLSVSFGKNEYHWSNYEDSKLQQRLQADIQRFGRLIKWISRFEFLTLFLSIDRVMKIARLSQEFRERMVYPLVALFFGTGNQTPNMSAAIVARVFNDPSLALFEYSPERLIDSEPTNFAFRNLEEFYNQKMRPYLEARGVRVLTSHRVEKVLKRSSDGVTLRISNLTNFEGVEYRAGGDQMLLSSSKAESPANPKTWDEDFDDLILACPANVSLQILGDNATFWERRVLGSVEYFDDLSVTHCDEEYMKKHFEVDGKAIYFIKSYEQDAKLLEMGFDLSGYQSSIGEGVRLSDEDEKPRRVYQTIFLDKKRKQDLWPLSEIKESLIIDKSWWHAFAHTMTHFRWVVPFVWLLHRQSAVKRTRTYFAGAWTLINTHDIAVVSGLAAAQRLGAPYPFAKNRLALEAYKTYWMVGHLTAPRK